MFINDLTLVGLLEHLLFDGGYSIDREILDLAQLFQQIILQRFDPIIMLVAKAALCCDFIEVVVIFDNFIV